MAKNYNPTSKDFHIGTKKYSFYGWDRDCRDGWNQYAELSVIDMDAPSYKRTKIAETKNHVINRTWEAYDHQNCYLDCIYLATENRIKVLKNILKEQHGKQRMTKQLYNELFTIEATDEIIRDLITLKEKIK